MNMFSHYIKQYQFKKMSKTSVMFTLLLFKSFFTNSVE